MRRSNAAMKAFRPDGLSEQAVPFMTKSLGLISPLFTTCRTVESAMIARNGSMRSSASAGRPCRSR